MARSIHFTTDDTDPPEAMLINSASDFLAVSATNAESATFYLKLWWSGNNNADPVVGTTIPSITLQIPDSGIVLNSLNFPLNLGGRLYVWATAAAADDDATALAGGDVITIIYD